jgi:hypothetical protein
MENSLFFFNITFLRSRLQAILLLFFLYVQLHYRVTISFKKNFMGGENMIFFPFSYFHAFNVRTIVI